MAKFSVGLLLLLSTFQIVLSARTVPTARQLAETYAPLVRMAKGDPWKPSSVEFFLNYTKLDGANGPAQLKPANLPMCQRGCFLTTKRHMDSETTDNLHVFYGQSLNKAPVYAFWEVTLSEVVIEYFMFYPYNRGKIICIGIAGSGKCEKKVWGVCVFYSPKCIGYSKSFGHHVGDWESIKVALDKEGLKYIQFKAHGTEYIFNKHNGQFVRDGQAIRFHGTHPIVYSAWGSHGARVTAGTHVYQTIPVNNKLKDVTSDGPAWHTWRNVVVIKKKKIGEYTGDESWVNFRGRWGNKKRGCRFWEKLSNECVQNSGPTGPY